MKRRAYLPKRAALLLMRSGPNLNQSMQARKELMAINVEGSQSAASKWLQRYSSSHDDFDIAWWMGTLENEIGVLKSNTGETSVEIASDLHRWIIEQISAIPKYHSEAIRIGTVFVDGRGIVPTLDSMTGYRTNRADEFAQWALKFRLPELVQQQHSMLPYSTLSREFQFGYLLAESFLLQGKDELAEKVAGLSRRQAACDSNGDPRLPTELDTRNPIRNTLDALMDRKGSSDLERRQSLGKQLRERGQFAWAEQEFRLALYRTDNKNRLEPPKPLENAKTKSQPLDAEDYVVPSPVPKQLVADMTHPRTLETMALLAECSTGNPDSKMQQMSFSLLSIDTRMSRCLKNK